MKRIDSPEYRQHYNWGWRYSGSESATLDYVDSKYGIGRKPGYDAALDGYLDRGASRDKWHLLRCPDHDACGEG